MNTTPQDLIDAVGNHLLEVGIAGGNIEYEPSEFDVDALEPEDEVCFVTMISDRTNDTGTLKIKSQIQISIEHLVQRRSMNQQPRRELLARSRILLTALLNLRELGLLRQVLPALGSLAPADHIIAIDAEEGWASIIRTVNIDYVENVEVTP